MKVAHSVSISVFSHSKNNENLDKIEESLKQFVPFNLEEEKIKIKETVAEGYNDNNTTIFELYLDKDRHINQFLESLLEKLSEEDLGKINEQLESRLDEHLQFFLRFEKETHLVEKKLVLTDSGDCFHIRMLLAAFPKKREKAFEILKELFST